jgi:hypothetical protein
MKTNIAWIKTDYKVQTAIGFLILLLSLIAAIGWFIHLTGSGLNVIWAFQSICLALVLFAPLGAWQVLSGLIYALGGDKLQQIYLAVVAIYFVSWGFAYSLKSDLLYFLLVIALVIAIWKYTVVRADYISLDIISVPDSDILDA